MIYSPMAYLRLNESHMNELCKNNGLIFVIGEVSELWHKTVVNMFFFVVFYSPRGLSILNIPLARGIL